MLYGFILHSDVEMASLDIKYVKKCEFVFASSIFVEMAFFFYLFFILLRHFMYRITYAAF